MPADWPWNVLGLEEPAQNSKELKRAYARNLKGIDQANEPDKFQDLRMAYDAAQKRLKYGKVEISNAPEPLTEFVAETVEAVANVEAPLVQETEPVRVNVWGPDPAEHLTGETDWDRIDRLAEQVFNEELPLAPLWAAILTDPAMADPNAAKTIEDRMMQYVCETAMLDNDTLYLSSRIDGQVVKLLEGHFHWLTDFTTLRNKFNCPDDILHALASLYLPPTEEELKLIERQKQEAADTWMLVKIGITIALGIAVVLPFTRSPSSSVMGGVVIATVYFIYKLIRPDR